MADKPDLETNADVNTNSLLGPAAPASEETGFRLLRYFSIASLVAIAAAAAVLAFLYRATAVEELTESGQNSNIALARSFTNTLRTEYVPLIEGAGGMSAGELAARAEVAILHQRVLQAVQGTSVVKVKIYDSNGRTLYSSEFRQIGEDKSTYPGFVGARAGRVQSQLERRESFHAFGQTIMNRHILGSYVPIRRSGSDAVEAVFELYSDVTPLFEEIRRTQTKIVAGVAAVLALLYGVLFVIVKRADDLIKRQTEERKQAGQALRRNAMRQGLIAAFGQRALASTDLDELLDQAMAVVREGLAVPFCRVLQLGPDGRSLILKAGSGWEAGWIDRASSDVDAETQNHYVLASREPVIVDDYRNETRFTPPEILTVHGIRCGVEVPIGGAGGPFGILGAYSREQCPFPPESATFLQSIANILETAVQRKSSEEKLAYLAQFDDLTGLPNRSLLSDRLAQTLTLAKRNRWVAAAMFIDLDRFKAVNDTYGHGIGDKLLKLVAQRLQECVRSGDTVGRLGGDEFAIVMSNLAKADDANLVAQKVVSALARPFDLDGLQTYMTASLGIALYPGDGEDPEVLLKNADTAMFRAKEQGRNAYQFYLPQMNERAAERLRTETQLRGALERGEFLLHYQPKVNLASGEISGFEALLRWQRPERGLVPPLEFISILEDTGLIVPVGEWVMRTACAQFKRWQAEGVAPRPIAVNLSARQFRQKNLDLVIAGILADTGVDPGLLELELTESMLMHNAEEAVRTLGRIKAYGVRLALDDFGTGYSSLAYLRRFPLDVLKIDRAFIRDAATDPDDAAIVLAMISLAHDMKLKVVAEGVETEAQLKFLRVRGCDEMQGYYFARPLPVSECTRALVENRRLKAPAVSAIPGAPAILIVDDSDEDLEIIKRALAPGGYRIVTAKSAGAGFEALAQGAFQIVISDYTMPGMNGVEFLAGVCTLYPDAVRILASGVGDMGTVTDAVNEASIHKFLPKEWDAVRMRSEVREAYLRRREEIKLMV